MEGQKRPVPEVVISIVSRSPEIRYGSRAMMIAAGIDPMCLCEIDATGDEWKERIGANAFVITDVVAARELPPGCNVNVYRVIADSSIAELKQLFGGTT